MEEKERANVEPTDVVEEEVFEEKEAAKAIYDLLSKAQHIAKRANIPLIAGVAASYKRTTGVLPFEKEKGKQLLTSSYIASVVSSSHDKADIRDTLVFYDAILQGVTGGRLRGIPSWMLCLFTKLHPMLEYSAARLLGYTDDAIREEDKNVATDVLALLHKAAADSCDALINSLPDSAKNFADEGIETDTPVPNKSDLN